MKITTLVILAALVTLGGCSSDETQSRVGPSSGQIVRASPSRLTGPNAGGAFKWVYGTVNVPGGKTEYVVTLCPKNDSFVLSGGYSSSIYVVVYDSFPVNFGQNNSMAGKST